MLSSPIVYTTAGNLCDLSMRMAVVAAAMLTGIFLSRSAGMISLVQKLGSNRLAQVDGGFGFHFFLWRRRPGR